jgi:hypothetical protein
MNIVNEDHGEVDVISDNKNTNMVTMDRMNEVKPEQVPTSQVVDLVNMNKVHIDVEVIVSDEDGYVANMVKRDMVDDTDSDVDSEYDEEMNELLSAQECGLFGNSDHEGRYDDGKMVEKH